MMRREDSNRRHNHHHHYHNILLEGRERGRERERGASRSHDGADAYDPTRFVGAPPLLPLHHRAAPDERSDVVGTPTDDGLLFKGKEIYFERSSDPPLFPPAALITAACHSPQRIAARPSSASFVFAAEKWSSKQHERWSWSPFAEK